MVDALLEHLNGMDVNIGFTMEKEKNEYLSFLDVSPRRESNGLLRTGVFRQATHTDRTSAFKSYHAPSVKKAVVRALMDRVETHFQLDDIEGKKEETLHVESILARISNPHAFVKKLQI